MGFLSELFSKRPHKNIAHNDQHDADQKQRCQGEGGWAVLPVEMKVAREVFKPRESLGQQDQYSSENNRNADDN